MNDKDKDKEAFEEWYKINFSELVKENGLAKMQNDFIKAWQAACEYKKKEFENLIEQDKILSKEIKTYIDIANRLQAENVKLRECVEWIGDMPEIGEASGYARKVLKELEEK